MEEKGEMISAEKIFENNRELEERRRNKGGDPMSYGSRE